MWEGAGLVVPERHNPCVQCSLLWDVETSVGGDLNVGGLLAPSVPLREAVITLVEQFLGFEQGGSFLRIWGFGRQGNQNVEERSKAALAGHPACAAGSPGGFWACFLLKVGWFGTWKRRCGGCAVAWACWAMGYRDEGILEPVPG